MDTEDVLMLFMCILMVGGIIWGLIDATHENSLPEYEQSKYTQNKIVKAMSIEEYNRTYEELNIQEKEHIIREYQIKKYTSDCTSEHGSTTPVIIPTHIGR